MRAQLWLLAAALAGAACESSTRPLDDDGDGYANTVDCNDEDVSAWTERTVFEDGDGDGVGDGSAVTRCLGWQAPAGYSLTAGDCALEDGARWKLADGVYLDADADGYTVGGPMTGCVGDGPLSTYGYRLDSQGPDCDDTDPAGWVSVTAFADADGDGVGDGPAAVRCTDGTPGAGYVWLDGDCSPTDPWAWRQVTAYADADSDGAVSGGPQSLCIGEHYPWGYTPNEGSADCDDSNSYVWQLLAYAHRDVDLDGATVPEEGTVCSGAALPPGYHDDARDAPDCHDGDAKIWQLLAYAHRDADGDGTTVPSTGTVCAGNYLPAGYATAPSGDDCDDADAAIWRQVDLYADADGDGVGAGEPETLCTDEGPWDGRSLVGTDCAPADAATWQVLPYAHVDEDADSYTVPSEGNVCAGATLPAPYRTVARGLDCDDGDPAVFVALDGYADADGDRVGAGEATTFCTAGRLPAGWSRTGTDCAPEDHLLWRLLAYAYVDRDGDYVTRPETGQVCSGDVLPPRYYTYAAGLDCDDADPALTRWGMRYPDGDDDGVGTTPGSVLCLGAMEPAQMSRFGDDPDDADPTVTEPDDEEELLILLGS